MARNHWYPRNDLFQALKRCRRRIPRLSLTASAELYGLDGELAYTPISGLNVRTGVSLLHGKYKEYRNAQVTVPTGLGGNASATIDASGKNIIRTPFFTVDAAFDYTTRAAPTPRM